MRKYATKQDYEGLTRTEILELIKKHETALKILKSLLGELRGKEEKAKHETSILIDIIHSHLGFKGDIYKEEAKKLLEKYIEDSAWKIRHSRRSLEALATAGILVVLDHYAVKYKLEDVNVFDVPKSNLMRLYSELKEYAEKEWWANG